MSHQTISLTLDEILAMLQLMSVPTLAGLEGFVAGLDEQQLALRVQKGVEILVNRGALTIRSADDIVLDEVLLGMVGSCVLPAATLMIVVETPGVVARHFFHVTPYLMVEQAPPDGEIVRFTHLPTPAAFRSRLETLLAPLHVTRLAAAPVDYHISEAALTPVLRTLRAGSAREATRALTAAGWSDAHAAAFAADGAGATWWHAVAAWGLRQPHPAGSRAATVVGGATMLWLLTRDETQPDQVRVTGASGQLCTTTLLTVGEPVVTTFGDGDRAVSEDR